MHTEITDTNAKLTGWIYYDAECPFCVRGVMRCREVFGRRGFQWLPLQTAGVADELRVTEADLRMEMKLLLADGRIAGGVAAWLILFRSVWWLWPIAIFLGLPGIRTIAHHAYAWIARNRYCLGGACRVRERNRKHRHGVFFELP